MKRDQMGTRTAHPSPQELLLSNGTRFNLARAMAFATRTLIRAEVSRLPRFISESLFEWACVADAYLIPQ